MRRLFILLAVALPPLLSGCDLLGIEGAGVVAAKREAEGKAIGGACRHAARSIEQCYASNKKADKAAIFAGWREMNDYMRENKIEAMPASEPLPPAGAAAEGEAEEDAPAAAAGKRPGARPNAAEAARPGGGKTAAAKPH